MSITFIVANKSKNTEIAGEKYFTDSTVSITHDFSNSVTENPVEDGVSFSDHVQVKNNRFTVNGVFGAFSVNNYAADTLSQDKERIKEAYAFLTNLRNNRTVFTLVSMYDVYENCVIESLSIPVNAESSSSLYFDMTLVQIRKASVQSTSLVRVENVIAAKKDDAASTSNGGKNSSSRVSALQSVEDYINESKKAIGSDSNKISPTEEAIIKHTNATKDGQ